MTSEFHLVPMLPLKASLFLETSKVALYDSKSKILAFLILTTGEVAPFIHHMKEDASSQLYSDWLPLPNRRFEH